MPDTANKQMENYQSTAGVSTIELAMMVDEMKQTAKNRRVLIMRQVAVRLLSKFRKFGEYLIETIPSQALKKEGVETKDETLIRDENIVRTAWRHAELNRNILAF